MGTVAVSVGIDNNCPVFATLDSAKNAVTLAYPHTAYFQRFPSDSIGSTIVTFDGAVAGSEIRVYLADGTEIAGVESCIINHALSWGIYNVGSPNNIVRIVIVNTAYKLKEFLYTSQAGAQSIPIQMEEDKWFSNPV